MLQPFHVMPEAESSNKPAERKESSEKSSESAQIHGETAGQVSDAPKDVNQLTPEEQMALYEDDLKETDWGHQPC